MLRYAEFLSRTRFSKEEILGLSQGNLVDDPPAEFVRLPAPPMLMIDRVLEIVHDGVRGRIVGEKDVEPTDWFFHCHFRGDPVQPGCLGVDAIWQLLGL
jgi:3-hydroxyacyl-[acyl-carrier protein] dehydratase/trans-2-decenoyl-[acyl-carrier protein] isomerase